MGKKQMRVMITGIDGYLGWPLALHLSKRGHEVWGIDNNSRRRLVEEVGGDSALPIDLVFCRIQKAHKKYGIRIWEGELEEEEFVRRLYEKFKPECIVYLGENPSAPWSMKDCNHAVEVQVNNIVGTLVTLHAMRDFCPNAHLLKLGTMGEYGTPNVYIPEGVFPEESYWKWNGATSNISGLMFPRNPGSFYHLSKVHDTFNIKFCCSNWGLRSTDVMQGVVYGTRTDEITGEEFTRFDYDQYFGTAVNRFCVQAVERLPITPYGKGGQTRGFLALRDSIQCLRIMVENPPGPGEYRTVNQFESPYSVHELAVKVASVADGFGLSPEIRHVENPRKELEKHSYEPARKKLIDLGYEPTTDMETELQYVFRDLLQYRNRIITDCLIPDIRWDGTRKKCEFLESGEVV